MNQPVGSIIIVKYTIKRNHNQKKSQSKENHIIRHLKLKVIYLALFRDFLWNLNKWKTKELLQLAQKRITF